MVVYVTKESDARRLLEDKYSGGAKVATRFATNPAPSS
jgi:hypothetical protein